MKYFVFSIVVLFSYSSLNAQGLLDKITGNKKDGATTTEFVSLGELSKKWSDGSYMERRQSGGMWEPKGKKEIKFTKDEKGEVTKIQVDDEEYVVEKASGATFIKSFNRRNNMIYLTESSLMIYYLSGSGVYLTYCYGSKMGLKAAKKEITAFREYADVKIKEEAEKSFEEGMALAEKREEERKLKYGLEGKDVKQIEMINLSVPAKFGYFRGFSFDMKATLNNGTIITTEGYDKGYLSDYQISYSAANYNGELQSGFVDEDAISITIKCVSNPSLIIKEKVVLKYNEDITYNKGGFNKSAGNGQSANNFKIEVKQYKHEVTGEDLLKIRITNVSKGEVIGEIKMGIDQTLHFNCGGGRGGDNNTDRGGSGIGHGGNGGNISVIKDPNVKQFNLNYSNYGGDPGGDIRANRGRDGSYNEQIKGVNF